MQVSGLIAQTGDWSHRRARAGPCDPVRDRTLVPMSRTRSVALTVALLVSGLLLAGHRVRPALGSLLWIRD